MIQSYEELSMKTKTEVKTVETTVESVITEVYCDNCGVLLRPVFTGTEEHPYSNAVQCVGVLHICLSGGYGMYFDDGDQSILFCETCANRLIEAFPSFNVF